MVLRLGRGDDDRGREALPPPQGLREYAETPRNTRSVPRILERRWHSVWAIGSLLKFNGNRDNPAGRSWCSSSRGITLLPQHPQPRPALTCPHRAGRPRGDFERHRLQATTQLPEAPGSQHGGPGARLGCRRNLETDPAEREERSLDSSPAFPENAPRPAPAGGQNPQPGLSPPKQGTEPSSPVGYSTTGSKVYKDRRLGLCSGKNLSTY